jgi:hypothetical protein
LPVYLIASPTGTGKTSAAAKAVAKMGATCWLADRHEDVEKVERLIEAVGGLVGTVVPLNGTQSDGTANCLHPEIFGLWQSKGYQYVPGFCMPRCSRKGNADQCPFLRSIADLEEAEIIVATKALARKPQFFSAFGNPRRRTVVLDEDLIGLLRPPVEVTRDEIQQFIKVIEKLEGIIGGKEDLFTAAARVAMARHVRHIAESLWTQISRQKPDGQHEAVDVPCSICPTKPVLKRTKRQRKIGLKALYSAFYRMMRVDPKGTIRNVCRDLFDLAYRAVSQVVFVTPNCAIFHLRVKIPGNKQVIILDATGNPALLRPLIAPRPVEVLCNQPVRPAGHIIQFMDFNGPRSYLNKVPKKLVHIIDAIGDLHSENSIVLISHQSCVSGLAKASRHVGRIKTAYFGALRGRNDLEPSQDNSIACHIVAGSPKTTEESRRQIALAVYGRTILPFADLTTLRRTVIGRQPDDLSEGEGGREQVWEVRIKGYADPRMQAVYDHTVTAELTHAADRARVLIHRDAAVYLVTNEPCPQLWFVERCFAGDFLDLSPSPRADFQVAYAQYEAKARELLNQGRRIGNADVCRALDRKPGWGKRYWSVLLSKYADVLEGERKVKWKGE